MNLQQKTNKTQLNHAPPPPSLEIAKQNSPRRYHSSSPNESPCQVGGPDKWEASAGIYLATLDVFSELVSLHWQ